MRLIIDGSVAEIEEFLGDLVNQEALLSDFVDAVQGIISAPRAPSIEEIKKADPPQRQDIKPGDNEQKTE